MEKISLIYKQNTSVIYSVLFLLGAVFIFFQVALPAFSSIGDLRTQVAAEEKKVEDYKSSAEILQKIDKKILSDQADIVTRALPPSKDIQAIYLALTQAASSANISIRGFSVKIGDIFQKSPLQKNNVTGVPFVTVNLLVSNADPASIYAFAQSLKKEFPLSTIINATVTSGEGDMDVAFYYKPYDLSVINRNVITQVSTQDQNTLNSLSAGKP